MSSGEAPLSPVGNGRESDGKFGRGNKLAKGNPLNRKVQRLRSEFIKTVTIADMREVATAVLNAAKSGDVAACRELLDRVIGKSVQVDLLERIEAIEQRLAERDGKPPMRVVGN